MGVAKSPIFLSYARIDNDKDQHDSRDGWIAYFHSRLRLLLSSKLGKRLDFWRDTQEIDKGATWHEPIKAALRDAKVLLPVLSPSFFASDNCSFELKHFLDCHADVGPTALAESVIKVLKHKIDPSVLPAPLREPEPFEFFITHPEKGELSYYTPATGLREDQKQAYMDELERLANRLVVLLRHVDEAAEPPVTTVYVAVPYPGSGVGELYHRIKAELERRNVKVVPDRKRIFNELDQLDPILLEQAVTNSRLAVHLLDPIAGKEAMSLDERQIKATATLAKDANRLQRLVWIQSKGESMVDNDLVGSLRRLESRGGRLLEGDRVVEESSERFIELLIRTLFPTEAGAENTTAPALFYVDFHGEEAPDVRARTIAELKRRGLRCRLPVPPTLKLSDRVAIYWGNKSSDWVFGEIDRMKGVCGLVLVKGPPANAEKATFFAEEIAETIDLTDTSTAASTT